MQPAIATGRGWRWVQYLMIEVEQAQIAPLGIWSSGATPIPNPTRGSVLSTGAFFVLGFHSRRRPQMPYSRMTASSTGSGEWVSARDLFSFPDKRVRISTKQISSKHTGDCIHSNHSFNSHITVQRGRGMNENIKSGVQRRSYFGTTVGVFYTYEKYRQQRSTKAQRA